MKRKDLILKDWNTQWMWKNCRVHCFFLWCKIKDCSAVQFIWTKANRCSISNIIILIRGTDIVLHCGVTVYSFIFCTHLFTSSESWSRNTQLCHSMTEDKHEGFQTFIYYQEQYKNLHRKKMSYLKHFFFKCKQKCSPEFVTVSVSSFFSPILLAVQ